MLLLEEIFRIKKVEFSEELNLRIQRGLSWFKKSNSFDHDLDVKFISLWISFNALHAQSIEQHLQQNNMRHFLTSTLTQDTERKIRAIVLTQHLQNIRTILDNTFTYSAYWDYQHKKITLDDYKQLLAQEKLNIQSVLEQQNVIEILVLVFERLYGLRHQMMEGGMICHSAIHRRQLQESCILLNKLIPTFMLILMEHPQQDEKVLPYYPMVQVS